MKDMIRAAVVIGKEQHFLLVQEGHAHAYGLWNWNQGKVEEGEDIEHVAVREAKEETGYDVAMVKKLAVINNPFTGTKEIHVFLGQIIGGELAINKGEILQAKWFTRADLSEIKATTPGPWVYDTIHAISD